MRNFLWTLGLLVLLGLVVSSCRRGGGIEESKAVDWSGIAPVVMARGDSEGFFYLRRGGEAWAGLPPEVRGLFASDSDFLRTQSNSQWGKFMGSLLTPEEGDPLPRRILRDIAGEEFFVILGSGTATQLATLQQVKRLFGAARLRDLFTPPMPGVPEDVAVLPTDNLESAAFTEVILPMPPAMEDALKSLAEQTKVPPLTFGAKLPADSPLPARLDAWLASLPAGIPRDTFSFAGGTFTRARIRITDMVPKAASMRARDLLGAAIGDPHTATLIIRSILAKETILSYGFTHGYFVLSIGQPEGIPLLASSIASSLAATEAMNIPAHLVGAETVAVLHADPLIVNLAASPPPVAEYLDAAMDSALEFAPADRIPKLKANAEALRDQAEDLLRPRATTFTGVLRHENVRWSASLFGGSLAPRLADENGHPLLAVTPDIAGLWTEYWKEDYASRLVNFTGHLGSFSADWLDALGSDFADEGPSTAFHLILRFLQQPAERLLQVDPALWSRAFTRDKALALDFAGIVPPPPFLPASAATTMLPRLAIVSGLDDREALTEIWKQITTTTPLDDAQSKSAWPPPIEHTTADGTQTFQYPLPLAGPDLGITSAIRDKRWILASSPAFAETVAAAPTDPKTQAIQTLHFNTTSFAPFAHAWATALTTDPDLAAATLGLLPRDPKLLQALAALAQTPRTLDYRVWWEEGRLRRELKF